MKLENIVYFNEVALKKQNYNVLQHVGFNNKASIVVLTRLKPNRYQRAFLVK